MLQAVLTEVAGIKKDLVSVKNQAKNQMKELKELKGQHEMASSAYKALNVQMASMHELLAQQGPCRGNG